MSLPVEVDKKTAYLGNPLIESHSKTEWSLYERKFFISMVAEVNPFEDDEFKTYTLTKFEAQKIIKCEKNTTHKELDILTDKLMSKFVNIADDNTKKLGGFKKRHIFEKCDYDPENKVLEVQFHKDMKPYLLALRRYAPVLVENVINMVYSYAIQIYTLCRSYLNKCEKDGYFQYTIDEFKSNLGIADKYKLFGHLKSRVIEPSIKEINSKTDLNVEYMTKKTGRKFTDIVFFVKLNSKEIETNNHDSLTTKLMHAGCSKKVSENLIEKYSSNVLMDVLNRVNLANDKTDIKNKAGLLMHFLKQKDIEIQEIKNQEDISKECEIKNSEWDIIESFCEENTNLINALYLFIANINHDFEINQISEYYTMLDAFVKKYDNYGESKRPILSLEIDGSIRTFSFLINLTNRVSERLSLSIIDLGDL
jgi:plasmid replication initiation protein